MTHEKVPGARTWPSVNDIVFDTLPDSTLLDETDAAYFLCSPTHGTQAWRSNPLSYVKIGKNLKWRTTSLYRLGELRKFLDECTRELVKYLDEHNETHTEE